MARRRVNFTRLEIVQTAARCIFQSGYTATSPKMICDELNLSTGNLTYYFPTKEHLLKVFVEMLCDFQWALMEKEADDGMSSVMAVCLELAAMAAICEEEPNAKDFYLSAYSSPLTLDVIRKNDVERAKKVYAAYCPDWTHERFLEAETLVSGVEYATLMTTEESPALDLRIAGALDTILTTYQVPEEIRRRKITEVLSMDYHSIGRRILKEFIAFIDETNEHTLEEMLHVKR